MQEALLLILKILELPIRQGQIIRLGEIAQIKEYWSPPSIERKRKERIVRVSFTPYKRSLTDIQIDVQKAIDETLMPAGVMVQISGAIKEQMEAFMDIALLMVVSLILVYLIMASQFESLKMPFIIMFSIPFAFSGVAIALFFTNTTLSVISGIGAVMLIGIVVKNAIVLVDFINLMRERGNELYEAIAISGRSRLRPVIMTSATTILGMLPLCNEHRIRFRTLEPDGYCSYRRTYLFNNGYSGSGTCCLCNLFKAWRKKQKPGCLF